MVLSPQASGKFAGAAETLQVTTKLLKLEEWSR
jgi:hypothetical protein